jgi:hypothetical protein
MNVREARALARRWMEEQSGDIPGFMGAVFAGSTNFVDDEAPMPPTSDVDIMILVDREERSLRKVAYHGIVIEASVTPADRMLRSAEAILGDFRYACHFAKPNILADPTGRLSEVQQEVAKEFARRPWIRKRCEMICDRLLNGFLGNGSMAQFLYPAGTVYSAASRLHYAILLAAEILVVADLRNPTVRRALVVSREVAESMGRPDLHESLLDVIGVAQMTRNQAEALLQTCMRAFDRAVEVKRTPFFMDSNMTRDSRVIVFDGIRQILDMDLHREAMWWTYNTYDAVQQVLQNDAPEAEKARHAEEYVQWLAVAGMETQEACERREGMLRDLTPELMRAAEVVMDRNPEVRC